MTQQAPRDDTATVMAWAREGTGLFETEVERLDDADLAAASLLPDWTRAHVVGHVALNAAALVNLFEWARTGVETPAYPDFATRDADIVEHATWPPERLRAKLVEENVTWARRAAELPDGAWSARVRTPQGRDIPVTEVPWMRVREVWIHAVDLDGATTFADFPAPLVDALLDDVTGKFAGSTECTPMLLVPTDRVRRWRVGAEGAAPFAGSASDAVEVTGAAADLLGWALGRTAGTGLASNAPEAAVPRPPRWL